MATHCVAFLKPGAGYFKLFHFGENLIWEQIVQSLCFFRSPREQNWGYLPCVPHWGIKLELKDTIIFKWDIIFIIIVVGGGDFIVTCQKSLCKTELKWTGRKLVWKFPELLILVFQWGVLEEWHLGNNFSGVKAGWKVFKKRRGKSLLFSEGRLLVTCLSNIKH